MYFDQITAQFEANLILKIELSKSEQSVKSNSGDGCKVTKESSGIVKGSVSLIVPGEITVCLFLHSVNINLVLVLESVIFSRLPEVVDSLLG